MRDTPAPKPTVEVDIQLTITKEQLNLLVDGMRAIADDSDDNIILLANLIQVQKAAA